MGRLNKYGDKKQVGGGLSLEKFAGAKVSKYNKQQVHEKLQEEKLRRRSKYKKLKHKLEGEGKLTIGGFEVVDNGAQIVGHGASCMRLCEESRSWKAPCEPLCMHM